MAKRKAKDRAKADGKGFLVRLGRRLHHRRFNIAADVGELVVSGWLSWLGQASTVAMGLCIPGMGVTLFV